MAPCGPAARGLLVSAIALTAATGVAASAARAGVPRQFIGVDVDQSVVKLANPGREFRLMAQAGIGSVRLALDWRALQPWPNWDAVPASERSGLRDEAGVPTDFRLADRLIGAAARTHLRVLVAVVRTPTWARAFPSRTGSPPLRSAQFAAALRALVSRYGPLGSFWGEHRGLPRQPVRAWQAWNEPNIPLFWDGGPVSGAPDPTWAREYAHLAAAAVSAVRATDPGGRIILAGLTNRSWEALDTLLAVDPSLARRVDAVAVHPYTATPTNMIRILALAHRVLRARGHARLPIVVSEWTWPSAAGHPNSAFGFEVTPLEQAARASQALKLLARARAPLRLTETYWFTWASTDDSSPASTSYYGVVSFAYSGLRRLDGTRATVAKPAFFAFRRAAQALETQTAISSPTGKTSSSLTNPISQL